MNSAEKHRFRRLCRLFIVLLLLLAATSGFASEIGDEIQGTLQDEEEAGSVFKKDWRFVPVPIPISDPTIGTGLAVAGLYLHPKKEGSSDTQTTLSGIVGLYTNTDSWMGAAFHSGSYGGDRYRVGGGLAYGEFNLKFYGIGNDSPIRDNPISYEAKTTAFLPRVLFRLPFDNWFFGPRYLFLKIDNTFDLSDILPPLPEIRIPTQTSGLGLVTVYDSRDSNLWPSEGSWFDLTVTSYGEYLGGDFDYEKYAVKWVQYFPLTASVTLAYRLDGQFIGGDAPFYDLSTLNLRGFAGGRYVDDHAVTAQLQGSWNFYRRWIGLLFGGGGRIAEEFGDLGSATTRWAGGAGIRYMVNQEQKLAVGFDITYGDHQIEFYVQIGDWLTK
jgi:hypothetical protein